MRLKVGIGYRRAQRRREQLLVGVGQLAGSKADEGRREPPPASAGPVDAERRSRNHATGRGVSLGGSLAMDLQRFLIGLGLVILVVGVLWPVLSRIGFGRLPGDIMFQRGGATFYFPLVSSIIASIVLTLLLWLFNR
jgi:hypothetical protein